MLLQYVMGKLAATVVAKEVQFTQVPTFVFETIWIMSIRLLEVMFTQSPFVIWMAVRTRERAICCVVAYRRLTDRNCSPDPVFAEHFNSLNRCRLYHSGSEYGIDS